MHFRIVRALTVVLLAAGVAVGLPDGTAGAAGTGSIAGTVTDRVTGDPIAKLPVFLQGSHATYGAVTAADGSFSHSGLPIGQYHVCANTVQSNGVPVPDPRPDGTGWLSGCRPGTVTILDGQPTSGVDFTLAPGGAISGQVTDQVSKDPVGHVEVRVIDGAGFVVDVFTRSDGTYRVVDIPTGTYYACFFADTADHSDFDRCYRNAANFTDATPISVVAGQLTPHIFGVLPSAGEIAGTVTRSPDGAPVQDVLVRAYLSGTLVSQEYSGPLGGYALTRLEPGHYTVCFNTTAAVNRIRQQGNVAGLLPVCTATTVQVSRGVVSTVDRVLDPAAAITGRVLSTATGDPVNASKILLYDGAGDVISAVSERSQFGFYTLEPDAEYRVCVDGSFGSSGSQFGFVSRCYRSAPWIPGDPPSPGAKVLVPPAGVRTNATVRLDPGGTIAGGLHSTSGRALDGEVQAFSPDGTLVAQVQSFVGDYVLPGVPPSAAGYTVCFTVDSYQPQCYSRQPWDGIAADLPSSATAVPVTVGTTTDGVNAHLIPAGSRARDRVHIATHR